MSGAAAPAERIADAIAGLVRSFATDGYDMRIVSFEDGSLKLAIDAQEGACAECLVPETMMSGLVRAKLPADLTNISIAIAYPLSSAH